MTVLYKATRLDGTDFHTGTVRWVPPEGHEGEWVIRHPIYTVLVRVDAHPSEYLSVTSDPTSLPGSSWPLRLHVVEPVGDTQEIGDFHGKIAGVAFRYVWEVPAHLRFGPQGVHVAALMERVSRLTPNELDRLDPAAAAARGAAGALVVRDLIGTHGFTQTHYDTLTGPWRKVIGKIHPDDEMAT